MSGAATHRADAPATPAKELQLHVCSCNSCRTSHGVLKAANRARRKTCRPHLVVRGMGVADGRDVLVLEDALDGSMVWLVLSAPLCHMGPPTAEAVS